MFMSITINNLSYIHTDKETLFQHISFSISAGDKIALIGNNGSGKSTLLRIVAGELQSSDGEIICSSKPYYIPQHFGQYDTQTISQALGVESKLAALNAILAGDVSINNMECLNDDWDIESRIANALQYWGLEDLELFRTMDTLSGGEKTKIFLSAIAIHAPEIILLDEPSNHLDQESRNLLYQFIKKSRATLLVVSHDRTLLNLLEPTVELKNDAVEIYGGNYDFYEKQKDEKLNALQAQLNEREKTLKQMKQKARDMAEQKQKNDVRGKKQKQKAGIPRIAMGTLKDKAEQSGAKQKSIQNEKINEVSLNIRQIREDIRQEEVLKIDFDKPDLHSGKLLVEAKGINFMYSEQPLWTTPLTVSFRSGDRLRIMGSNGSGKTTLIKIITGKLSPSSGTMFIGDFKYVYIDQEYSIIDNTLSVFEQVDRFNDRHLPEHELKMLLHRCQFSKDVWHRACSHFSGGEKMKLILCCLTISNNMPDILILDEPTNNLDIQSQKILISAIKNFGGSIIVISHDGSFVDEIDADKTICID